AASARGRSWNPRSCAGGTLPLPGGNRIPCRFDLAHHRQRFLQGDVVAIEVGLGQALDDEVVQGREVAGDLAPSLMVDRAVEVAAVPAPSPMVERTVEVADDGAGFASRLAYGALFALGQKGFSAADAGSGTSEQQGHQFVLIGIHHTGGNADLAVLLGVIAG